MWDGLRQADILQEAQQILTAKETVDPASQGTTGMLSSGLSGLWDMLVWIKYYSLDLNSSTSSTYIIARENDNYI